MLKEENKQLGILKDKLLDKIEDIETKELSDVSVNLKLREWQQGIEKILEQAHKKSSQEGF